MVNNYTENIYNAIQMVVGEALVKAGYDKTVQATVLKQVDSATGKYRVKYQDSIFDAYATNTEIVYSPQTSVYVLIPNNDMTVHKTILGLVKNEGLISNQYISMKNRFLDYGENIIELKRDFGLCSYECVTIKENAQPKEPGASTQDIFQNLGVITIYSAEEPNMSPLNVSDDIIETNNVKINLAGLKHYILEESNVDSLKIGGIFRNELPTEQQAFGNYGLIFTFGYKNADGNKDYINFTLSVEDMTGSPYKYFVNSEQTKYADISGTEIISLEKIVFFEKNFPNSIFVEKTEYENDLYEKVITDDNEYYQLVTTQEQGKTYYERIKKPVDLFLHGVILQGCEKLSTESLAGTFLRLTTPKGTIFFRGDSQTSDRPLQAQIWTKGAPVAAEDKTSLDYYWFVEDTDANSSNAASGYTSLGGNGWKCLNSKNVTTGNYLGSNGNYIVRKSDLKFRDQTYKVVGIYNSDKYEKIVTLLNLGAEYEATLTTKSGQTIYGNNTSSIDTIILSLKYNENEIEIGNGVVNILWYYEDEYGNYQPVEPTDSTKKNVFVNLGEMAKNHNRKYFCKIILDDISNTEYTKSIILQKVESLGERYTLIINNPNGAFVYDESGISPASKSLKDPAAISPLSFKIYDNKLGLEISADEVPAGKIFWQFPADQTLLIPPIAFKYIYQQKEISFSLEEEYNASKINNQLLLKVEYRGLTLTQDIDILCLKQGNLGTNGTDYYTKILPIKEAIQNSWYYKEDNSVRFIPYKYNSETQKISLLLNKEQQNIPLYKVILYSHGEQIFEGTTSGFAYNSTDKNEAVEVEWKIKRNPSPFEEEEPLYSIDDSGVFKIADDIKVEDINDFFSKRCHLLQATVKYKGKEIINFVPIGTLIFLKNKLSNFSFGLTPFSGFTEVKYNQDGLKPQYSNQKGFQARIYMPDPSEDIEFEKDDWDWIGIGQVKQRGKDWLNGNNLIDQRDNSLSVLQMKPADRCNSLCITNAALGYYNGKIDDVDTEMYAHVPIAFYINRYPDGLLNGWDGNAIEINEEDGVILAPKIAAGRKETDNSFTGAIMGLTKTKTKGQEETLDNVGLAGFGHGIRTFLLDAETGNATFGTEGDGSIKIKPIVSSSTGKINNEATIESGIYEYNINGEGRGLQIGFGQLPFIKYGNGKFQVDSNGNLTAQDAIIHGKFIAKNENSYDKSQINIGTDGTKDGASKIQLFGYQDYENEEGEIEHRQSSQIHLEQDIFEVSSYDIETQKEKSYLKFKNRQLELKGKFKAESDSAKVLFGDTTETTSIKFLDKSSVYTNAQINSSNTVIQDSLLLYKALFETWPPSAEEELEKNEALQNELGLLNTQEIFIHVENPKTEDIKTYYEETKDGEYIITEDLIVQPNKEYFQKIEDTILNIYNEINIQYNKANQQLEDVMNKKRHVELLEIAEKNQKDQLFTISSTLNNKEKALRIENDNDWYVYSNKEWIECAALEKKNKGILSDIEKKLKQVRKERDSSYENYIAQRDALLKDLDKYSIKVLTLFESSTYDDLQKKALGFCTLYGPNLDMYFDETGYNSDLEVISLQNQYKEKCFKGIKDYYKTMGIELEDEDKIYLKSLNNEFTFLLQGSSSDFVKSNLTNYKMILSNLSKITSSISQYKPILDYWNNPENNLENIEIKYPSKALFDKLQEAITAAQNKQSTTTLIKARTYISPGAFEITSYETYDDYLNCAYGFETPITEDFDAYWREAGKTRIEDIPVANKPEIRSQLKYDSEEAVLSYFGELDFAAPPFAKLSMKKQNENGTNNSEIYFKEFFLGATENPVSGKVEYLTLSDITNHLSDYEKSTIQLKSGLFKLASYDYPEAFLRTLPSDDQLKKINEHSITMKNGRVTLKNLEFSLKTPCVDVALMNESERTHINMTGYSEDEEGNYIEDTSVNITPFKFKITGKNSRLFYNPKTSSLEYQGDINIKNDNGQFRMRGKTSTASPDLRFQFGTTLNDYSKDDVNYGEIIQEIQNDTLDESLMNLKVTEFRITPKEFLMCSYGPDEQWQKQQKLLTEGKKSYNSMDCTSYRTSPAELTSQASFDSYFSQEFLPEDNVSQSIQTYLASSGGVLVDTSNLTANEKKRADIWLNLYYSTPYISSITITFQDSGHTVSAQKDVPEEFPPMGDFQYNRTEFVIDANGEYFYNDATKRYEKVTAATPEGVRYSPRTVTETIDYQEQSSSAFVDNGIDYKESVFQNEEKKNIRWTRKSGLSYNSSTGKFSLNGDFSVRNKHGSVIFSDEIMRIMFRSYYEDENDDKELKSPKTRMCIAEDSFYFYSFGQVAEINSTGKSSYRGNDYLSLPSEKTKPGITGALCWRDGTLNIIGTITASSGTIGGWELSSNAISSANGNIALKDSGIIDITGGDINNANQGNSGAIRAIFCNRRTGLISGSLLVEGNGVDEIVDRALLEMNTDIDSALKEILVPAYGAYIEEEAPDADKVKKEFINGKNWGTVDFVTNVKAGKIKDDKYSAQKKKADESEEGSKDKVFFDAMDTYNNAIQEAKKVYVNKVNGEQQKTENDDDYGWNNYGMVTGGYGRNNGLLISAEGATKNSDIGLIYGKTYTTTKELGVVVEEAEDEANKKIIRRERPVETQKDTYRNIYIGLGLNKKELDEAMYNQNIENKGSSGEDSEINQDIPKEYPETFERSTVITIGNSYIPDNFITKEKLEDANQNLTLIEDEDKYGQKLYGSLNFVVGLYKKAEEEKGYIYGTQVMPHLVKTNDIYLTGLFRDETKEKDSNNALYPEGMQMSNYCLKNNSSLEGIIQELGAIPSKIECLEAIDHEKIEDVTYTIKTIEETWTHNGIIDYKNGFSDFDNKIGFSKTWKIYLYNPEEEDSSTTENTDELEVKMICLVNENQETIATMDVSGFSFTI